MQYNIIVWSLQRGFHQDNIIIIDNNISTLILDKNYKSDSCSLISLTIMIFQNLLLKYTKNNEIISSVDFPSLFDLFRMRSSKMTSIRLLWIKVSHIFTNSVQIGNVRHVCHSNVQ